MGFICRTCTHNGPNWTVASALFSFETGQMAFEFQCPSCDGIDIMLLMDSEPDDDTFRFDLEIPDDSIEVDPFDLIPFGSDPDTPHHEYIEILEEWISEDEDDPTFIP